MPFSSPVTSRSIGRGAVLYFKQSEGGNSVLSALTTHQVCTMSLDTGRFSQHICWGLPPILCRIGGKCFCCIINCNQQDNLSNADGSVLDRKCKKKKKEKL